jgi:hypothetical protein
MSLAGRSFILVPSLSRRQRIWKMVNQMTKKEPIAIVHAVCMSSFSDGRFWTVAATPMMAKPQKEQRMRTASVLLQDEERGWNSTPR